MCGIAGFIGKTQKWQTEIVNMCNKIVHRGPDAEGFWSDENTEVVLGHRRLSVLDLSDNGTQPMLSHNVRYVISFNGEIYNYMEIAKELKASNGSVDFKTKTDTEILLEAISEWGITETLKKTRGMFAFALFDRKEKILYLSRDRMGEKPLYYGMVGKRFVFASDLACIEELEGFNNEISLEALKIYFQHGYIPAPYSIYDGVYKLEVGTILALKEQDLTYQIAQYWSVEEVAVKGQNNLFTGSEEEAAEELKKLLKESIKMQMLADVPVGAFLSAGIDSSTIVALMQDMTQIPVKTFTIGVESGKYNEAVAAREIAEILGTDHTELYISEKDSQIVIPQLSQYYSEPFADSSQIPTMLVSKLARQQVTVSLSGDGGDELFAGYKYYSFINNVWKQISQIPKPLRKLGEWSARNIPLFNKSKWVDQGKILACRSPEDIYNWDRERNFNTAILNREIEAYSKNDSCKSWVFDECQHNIMLMDLQMYHPDDILVKVDRAAMAYSLETRVPMLDTRVVEFAWTLPFAYKKSNGITKKVLRNVLYQYVPRELMDRPKTGFSIPLDQWLKEKELKDWAEDLFQSLAVREKDIFNWKEIFTMWDNYLQNGVWMETIWRLLVFCEWMNRNSNSPVTLWK